MSNPKKILNMLSGQERRRAFLLLGMIVVMSLLEVVGVASIMPFMSVLTKPEAVENNVYLNTVYRLLGFKETHSFLLFLGVMVFIVLITSISFRALTTYALMRFTQMRNYSISKRLVAGYLRQPYDWFLCRHSADLGKSVLSEVTQVVNGALIPMMYCIAHGAVVLALLALLIAVQPELALLVTAGLGGSYAVIYLALRRYIGRIGEERVEANRRRFEVVHEAFGGIKDIKFAGLEGTILRRFDGPAKLFARTQTASQVASQLPRYILEIVAFGGLLIVVLYLMAGEGGSQEALPVIALYALAGYRLMPALQQVYGQLSKMRFAGPAVDALFKDLNALNQGGGEVLILKRPEPLGVNSCISLQQVSYTYPGAVIPALDGLTLEIPVRTTVGFVGATGSGKTTAVDIILGLLQPQSGQLLVDGNPINTKNTLAWQRSLGYVPQHIYLADDSVAANIAFGIPADQIDQQSVEHAARIANMHDFVTGELPDGYHTRVGERGVRFSGGQRQRIGIARALYHDPQVLILDEATSALDNLTEKAVMEAMHNLGHRKTIILIAHRLSTVRACDQIFLLDKGVVEARGSFEELIAKNTRFCDMASGMSGT